MLKHGNEQTNIYPYILYTLMFNACWLPDAPINIQLYFLPTLRVFSIYLRTNSDMCHLQHKLICFYNRDEKCLQRGTDWVFK